MTTIAAITLLILFAINIIHWRIHRGSRWLYIPQPGFVRAVFIAMLVGIVALAVLFVVGIRSPWADVVGFAYGIALHLYSIFRRYMTQEVLSDAKT